MPILTSSTGRGFMKLWKDVSGTKLKIPFKPGCPYFLASGIEKAPLSGGVASKKALYTVFERIHVQQFVMT